METIDVIATISVILLAICVAICVYIFRNPFRYPYYKHSFDVSGKRQVNIEDYIDQYLCVSYNWDKLCSHNQKIKDWKEASEKYIDRCVFKKLRGKQLSQRIDDNHAFVFYTTRLQTRYIQRNYVKTPYKVKVEDGFYQTSWQWLENRYQKLKDIKFQSTLKNFNSQKQRSIMTRELREKIMRRDNYTCQICGKQMFDEVGLQIDHIIPIAKGGKSIPSNLQVLCNKCNGRKGGR